jgi:hypothetical protein
MALFVGYVVTTPFSEDKDIERAPIFRADLNNHLVLSAAFLDRCDFSGKRAHDWA